MDGICRGNVYTWQGKEVTREELEKMREALGSGRYSQKAIARDIGIGPETVRSFIRYPERDARISTVMALKDWLKEYGGWDK